MKKSLCLAALGLTLAQTSLSETQHVDSTGCSFYVSNFLHTSQSRYGSSAEYFLISFEFPAEATELGMYAKYSNGEKTLEKTQLAAKPSYLSYEPQSHVTFYTRGENEAGEKEYYTLEQFAFFYDTVDAEGTTTRHWLKDGWQDFSGDSVDREVFQYTDPVVWGYGRATYLRHDSGSPVFDRRNECN